LNPVGGIFDLEIERMPEYPFKVVSDWRQLDPD